jgi:hypothetical protein
MVEKSNKEEEKDPKAHELAEVDQTKQNVPIDPDVADMLDLLESKMKQLKLDDS